MTACLLGLLAAELHAAPGAWSRHSTGLGLRRAEIATSAELPVETWLVRLDPARHELRALPQLPIAPEERAAALASSVAEASGALAVVNASYFDERGRPLGLLVADGSTLGPANRQGWAWAAVVGDELVLREASGKVPAGTRQAVQAGPLLVRGGKALGLTSSRSARRSFVGSDAAGRIVLGATNGAVTLAQLAAFLALPESAGGAGLAEALNLDGGSSSQLHVSGETAPLKVAGIPVPVFLGVFPKADSPDSPSPSPSPSP